MAIAMSVALIKFKKVFCLIYILENMDMQNLCIQKFVIKQKRLANRLLWSDSLSLCTIIL